MNKWIKKIWYILIPFKIFYWIFKYCRRYYFFHFFAPTVGQPPAFLFTILFFILHTSVMREREREKMREREQERAGQLLAQACNPSYLGGRD
jgi:hypothetical protein